jgi:S-adenosylmethionine decarboxylase
MIWKNLAPKLIRQRVIIEATSDKIIEVEQIEDFLMELSKITNMKVVSGPYAYSAHECGFGGWIHWKTSGAHFYSYPTKPLLLTIDIYTCKKFSIKKSIEFVKKYFNIIDLVWKEIKV